MKKLAYLLHLSILLVSCGSGNSVAVDSGQVTVIVDSAIWFENAVKADPTNFTLLLEKSRFHLRRSEVDAAQTDLEKYLSLDSSNLDVQKLYADILLSKLVLDKSKYHYEYIIERDSTYAPAYLGIGKIYAILENNAAAIAYLNKSLTIDPYQSEPYFMKGMIYRSDFLETGRTSSWDLALSSFQTAIEQDPDNYSAYVQLGVMHDQQGDSTAIQYYNSAIDIYPNSIEAWYNKGMYYQVRGNIDEAFLCYRQLNEIDSSWADPYYNQGYIHLIMTENLDSAIFYFSKATELDPGYFQAYNNIGLAYEKKGDLSNARSYYGKAVEVNPDFQLAKDNLNRLR